MATTTFATKTAVCNVSYGSNWIEIVSPTGNAMRLECGPTSDLSFCSYEEYTFLNKLTCNNNDEDSDTVLTYPQLKMFKDIVEKHTARVTKEVKAVEEEIKLPDDVDSKIRKIALICRNLKRASQDKRPLHKISWYIPTRVSSPVSKGGHGMFADLAARVKERGMVEFDGSNYYGFIESKPTDMMEELDKWNKRPEVAATEFLPKSMRLLVKCDWDEVHPNKMQQRRDEAFVNLRDALVTAQLSLMENVDNATKRLDETMATLAAAEKKATTKELQDAHKKRISNVYSAIAVAKTNLENALKAAQLFDETESLEPLFAGLRDAIKSSNAAWIAAKRAAKK